MQFTFLAGLVAAVAVGVGAQTSIRYAAQHEPTITTQRACD